MNDEAKEQQRKTQQIQEWWRNKAQQGSEHVPYYIARINELEAENERLLAKTRDQAILLQDYKRRLRTPHK